MIKRLESVSVIGKHSFEPVTYSGPHYTVAVSHSGQKLVNPINSLPKSKLRMELSIECSICLRAR